jgi:hypothetical protein
MPRLIYYQFENQEITAKLSASIVRLYARYHQFDTREMIDHVAFLILDAGMGLINRRSALHGRDSKMQRISSIKCSEVLSCGAHTNVSPHRTTRKSNPIVNRDKVTWIHS